MTTIAEKSNILDAFLSNGEALKEIVSFATGENGDILRLKGTQIVSFEAFLASLKQSGSDTVVDLGNNQQIVLKNVLASSLTRANLSLDLELPQSATANSWLNTSQAVNGVVTGTAKNDSFGAGSDMIYAGGQGDDTYGVSSLTKNVTFVEKAGEGIDTVNSWVSFALPTEQSIENLILSGAGAINATGNALDNRITGNIGNNVITGGAGNDMLIGNGGKDTFVFRPGDGLDVVTDFAATGADADVIRLERFSYDSFESLKSVMTEAGGNTTLWLGPGSTIVLRNTRMADLSAANFQFADVVVADVIKPPAIGPDIIGGAGSDTLKGTASAELIDGRAGNDVLTGGAGRDTFVIGKGNGSDTITDFAAGKDGDVLRLQGYGFKDFAAVLAASTQSGKDTIIKVGAETLTLNGVQKTLLTADNVSLDYQLATSGAVASRFDTSSAGTKLVGTTGNDALSSNASNVTLIGGKGDDTYVVSSAAVTIVENAGEGVDTVVAWTGEGFSLARTENVENLTLGGNSNAWGVGNALANIIIGSTGNNIINGLGGNDILTGNGGSDIFIISAGNGSDVITDFSTASTGMDQVRLDGYGFKDFSAIKSAMTQIGSDTVINLGGGETLTLRDVAMNQLTDEHFLLPVAVKGMTQTFGDEFLGFDRASQGAGTWQTSLPWGGDSAYIHWGEQGIFVDKDFNGVTSAKSQKSLGLNPFEVVGGKLVITASPTDKGLSSYLGGQSFTTGMISTETSFWQTYGYFEISASLPTEQGAFPAFWMLPVDKVAPTELDIFEGLGNRKDAVHVQTISSTGSSMNGAWVPVGDLSEQHTYGVKWTPYDITFYVDGQKVATYGTPTDMNRAMYMIANLSMGGAWGGSAVAGTTSQMTIDYIRAYQLAEYTLAGYTLKTSVASVNTVVGTSASQTLNGTAAHDMIDSAGGADIMSGGLGDDTYIVSHVDAKVVEGFDGGIDTVRSSVNFTLSDNVENLTLTGSASIRATGNSMANIIVGNSGNNVITGGQGNDILTGGGGKDVFVITKNDGSDIITDFGSDDQVQLNKYAFTSFEEIRDAMVQTGNDVYLKLSAYETLVFRNQKVDGFNTGQFVIPEKPQVSEGSISWKIGTSASEELYGSGSNETFQGSASKFVGGLGDDIYYVDGKAVVVEKAGEGIDTEIFYSYGTRILSDNVENLTLMYASTGIGNKLGNIITGSSGADVINGKGGNDWLIGGAGNDNFIYEKNSGRDTIADFHSSLSAGSERDHITFMGYDKGAVLTNDGDIWSIRYNGGVDTFRIAGVTAMGASDYHFA